MHADARRVAHHDQAPGQASLEELDAFFLRHQSFRFPIGHEVETDQQPFSANVRDGTAPRCQLVESIAQNTSDCRRILDQSLRQDRLDRDQRRGRGERVSSVAR